VRTLPLRIRSVSAARVSSSGREERRLAERGQQVVGESDLASGAGGRVKGDAPGQLYSALQADRSLVASPKQIMTGTSEL
jgi:hypothetical protein